MRYNIDIKIVRGTESHTEKAIVDSNTVFLPVTADVIEGDLMIRMLPNGREDRMIATEVSVLQSPFGNSALDHTEVKFKSETSANRARTAGVVNNYSAENMQVTAGDSYGMTMNIGYNAEELESLLDGLLSILEANGVQVDQDGETNEVEDSGKTRFSKLLPALKEGGRMIADNGIGTVFDLGLKVLCLQYGIQ